MTPEQLQRLRELVDRLRWADWQSGKRTGRTRDFGHPGPLGPAGSRGEATQQEVETLLFVAHNATDSLFEDLNVDDH